MARGYYGSRLSDNIAQTDEGYLVCTDVVLARTGFQPYQVSELPKDALEKFGIDATNPTATVSIYRPAEEVFSDTALSSLEGKPVTYNHPANGDFVNPGNIQELGMGHVQNVHKGDEALDSGDWPVLGDVIITREPLLSAVGNGQQRELSVGYDYELDKDGDRLIQTKILGNHVAVVPKARAGSEARINDADPAQLTEADTWEGASHSQESSSSRPADRQQAVPIPNKEKPKMAVKNWVDNLLGRGLKQLATDAEPEELAEAAKAAAGATKKEAEDSVVGDRRADDRHHADDHIKHAHDCGCKDCMDRRRANDSIKHADDCGCASCKDKRASDAAKAGDGKTGDGKTGDATDGHHADDHRTDDRRGRLHGMLDRYLDGKEQEERLVSGIEDADMEALREWLDEESHEPEHSGDTADPGIQPIPEIAGETPVRAADGRSRIVEPIREGASQVDDDDLALIEALRPVLARATDARSLKARDLLNARIRKINGKSKPVAAGAGYIQVARAAAAGRTQDNDPRLAVQDYSKLEQAYATRFRKDAKELKGVN